MSSNDIRQRLSRFARASVSFPGCDRVFCTVFRFPRTISEHFNVVQYLYNVRQLSKFRNFGTGTM